VLEVIRKLGYRKTAAMSVALPEAEDWTEPADAPPFNGPTDGSDSDEEADADADELWPDDEAVLDSVAPRHSD
jgi:hypothetical protein